MDLLKDITKDDILNALGLEAKDRHGAVQPLGVFGMGLLVGAGLAFLFAPKAGRDLRHDISDRVGDITDKVGEMKDRYFSGTKTSGMGQGRTTHT